MKKKCILLLLSAISLNLYCQQLSNDTIGHSNKIRLSEIYMGLGAGGSVGAGGGIIGPFGTSGTFIFNNRLGLSINWKGSVFKAKNLPDDYNGVFSPLDDISISSFMFVCEQPFVKLERRVGIEVGPAWINYSETIFTINPKYVEYIENDEICFLCFPPQKYLRSTELKKVNGFSLRLKLEYPTTRFVGFEVVFIANINKYKTFVGLEFYLTYGLVNSRIKPKK